MGANKIGDKIRFTASNINETWLIYSLAIYHYVKVQELDELRGFGGKQQISKNRVVFFWWEGRVKCNSLYFSTKQC